MRLKNCLNCNSNLPRKKEKYCSDKCRKSYYKRKNNPNIRYWKYILDFIKDKKHISYRQLGLTYYEKIYGNNLKNTLRKDLLTKINRKFSSLLSFLVREKKIISYNKGNQNKRYYINNELIETINQIIEGNFIGINIQKSNKTRKVNIDNLDWIPFNELTTYSLYFLCKLDNKPIDSMFREIYNKSE